MTTEFQTERLILRPFTMDDFEDWYPLDQDPRVMKYLWQCKPKPRSREDALNVMNNIVKYYEQFPGFGVFATIEKASGLLIGWTSIKDLDNTELTEVGYRYFYDFWGKGYATEAATALVEHGFKTLNLPKIVAITHPDHEASQRVLEKLGMKYIKRAFYYNTDADYFELLRSEYDNL